MGQIQIDDLVVVLPGVTGSRLSKNGQEVWGASGSALAGVLRTFGRNIQDLRLPSGVGDEDPEDGVVATALMNDFHVLFWRPVRGYAGFLRWLQSQFALRQQSDPSAKDLGVNFLPFAYDWRLSNRLSAWRLKNAIEPALEQWREKSGKKDAQIIFLCHSMGGLVARYYAECLGGWEQTRELITFGTPHRGSLNSLLSLVNGHSMLSLDLTDLVRSLPSMYQLLPTYGCIDDPASRKLLKLDEVDLPELSRAAVEDGLRFHDEIRRGGSDGDHQYLFSAIVGLQQPTAASACVRDAGLVAIPTIRTETPGGSETDDPRGDGTVPRFSAELAEDGVRAPSAVWQPEQHGSLHLNQAVQNHVFGALTRRHVTYRESSRLARPLVGIELPDIVRTGAEWTVPISATDDSLRLKMTIRESGGQSRTVAVANRGNGRYDATVPIVREGPHEFQVHSPFDGHDVPDPVTGAALAVVEI